LLHPSISAIRLRTMDLQEVQNATVRFLQDANAQFHRLPGSSIAVRYIKSSYQDDPVRSAIELFLFLFAVRYLLAPKYSTKKKVQLTDAVCAAEVIGRL
jgi:serine palmitoyltransferase